jgi:hypothetical protein
MLFNGKRRQLVWRYDMVSFRATDLCPTWIKSLIRQSKRNNAVAEYLFCNAIQAASQLVLFRASGSWPPLWSSGQSSWIQIRRPGFDSRHYQKKVVGLERGALSLVSTTEELLDRKIAAPVYKTENTTVGIRHADHVAPFISKSW